MSVSSFFLKKPPLTLYNGFLGSDTAVLQWKTGDPFLAPQAVVITRSELLVELELCFLGEKYMEKAESRRK